MRQILVGILLLVATSIATAGDFTYTLSSAEEATILLANNVAVDAAPAIRQLTVSQYLTPLIADNLAALQTAQRHRATQRILRAVEKADAAKRAQIETDLGLTQ